MREREQVKKRLNWSDLVLSAWDPMGVCTAPSRYGRLLETRNHIRSPNGPQSMIDGPRKDTLTRLRSNGRSSLWLSSLTTTYSLFNNCGTRPGGTPGPTSPQGRLLSPTSLLTKMYPCLLNLTTTTLPSLLPTAASKTSGNTLSCSTSSRS